MISMGAENTKIYFSRDFAPNSHTSAPARPLADGETTSCHRADKNEAEQHEDTCAVCTFVTENYMMTGTLMNLSRSHVTVAPRLGRNHVSTIGVFILLPSIPLFVPLFPFPADSPLESGLESAEAEPSRHRPPNSFTFSAF